MMSFRFFEQPPDSVCWLPSLVPKPDSSEWLACNQLPSVAFSGVRTARIAQAAERFLGRLEGVCSKSNSRPKAGLLKIHRAGRVSLDIHCAASSKAHPELGEDESYQLTLFPETAAICLRANSEWGILHGLETLAQSLCSQATGWRLPVIAVKDKPAYPWRGLCLDLCRHWIGPRKIRHIVDGMACSKLNVLHLHLSDDQAFRLALDSVPKQSNEFEQLSRKQVADLVEYAAMRGIRLVPEIDLPGHSTALLARLPELAAGSPPTSPSGEFGGHTHCLNPVREQTWRILEGIFAEIAEWFPDSYIHTGGDEVNSASWSENPEIRRFMKDHELSDHAGLQALFHSRLGAVLARLGKRMILWDEAVHPNLDKATLIQCWRGVKARDMAISAGHSVLFSSGYYLDQNYSAFVHHGFDPAASSKDLEAAEQAILSAPGLGNLQALLPELLKGVGVADSGKVLPQQTVDSVLGGEACLWSELVDEAALDSRLFSRLPAVAERLWLGGRVESEDCAGDLYTRLQGHWHYLERVTHLEPLTQASRRLRGFGLSNEAVSAAEVLLSSLEPLKWHWRLLGDECLQARAAGVESATERPYRVSSPLNRMVDICPPESILTRQLEQAATRLQSKADPILSGELLELAKTWQQQAIVLNKTDSPLIDEVLTLSRWLGRLGGLLAGQIRGELQTDRRAWQAELDEMKEIAGELLLTVVAPVETLLDQFDGDQSEGRKKQTNTPEKGKNE